MSLESVNLRHKKIKNDLSDKRHDMRHHSRRQLWDQPARSTLSLPSRRECRFGSFLSLHLSRRHTHGSHESKKIPFAINIKELSVIGGLGVLFAVSSLTLFTSFYFMDAGIASTLLFVYPIMVAVIMAIFFHEKITFSTTLSILLALSGIAMLYKSDGNETLSTIGIILVMVSSLSYALYIIIINRSGLRMSAIKLTFYVLLFCILTIIVHSCMGQSYRLQLLTTPYMWFFAFLLAVLPTVISLVTMSIAVRIIGSTPTAILGALEPLTAIAIGVTLFHEPFTPRLASGILLILSGVILIILGKSIRPRNLRLILDHLRRLLQTALGKK